jgi:Radical SAM superfamily
VAIHLINPSDHSFGIGFMAPRWLYVLAHATPERFGLPQLTDETLEPLDLSGIASGDVVGIGIHTSNALRGYMIGRAAREAGAFVVFGGIHATLFPNEARERGGAHAVVRGDGDVVWARVLDDYSTGTALPLYEGGQVDPEFLRPGRWDLMPANRYMWGSVQTVRGCPKHCSFCSVWKTDGQRPRQRLSDPVVEEIVDLRRRGFRFVILADDNFYTVTLTDLQMARRRADQRRYEMLRTLRAERFELMNRLAQLPDDMVLYTQITMEAAEDPEFLAAMARARIKGALVGVEAVTPEGLKDVHKGFNEVGERLVDRLRAFRHHGVHVLGSFIFGLPSDRAATFMATVDIAERADITFAQFLMLTPFPGTNDFADWERQMAADTTRIDGHPLTRHWLIPQPLRPKVYAPHPVMSSEDIRLGTQMAWDRFYSWSSIWKRSSCVRSLKARLAFVLVSKLYRQMYGNTGIATDSARVERGARWARWLARPCRRLFAGTPMPHLEVPASFMNYTGGINVRTERGSREVSHRSTAEITTAPAHPRADETRPTDSEETIAWRP